MSYSTVCLMRGTNEYIFVDWRKCPMLPVGCQSLPEQRVAADPHAKAWPEGSGRLRGMGHPI